MLFLRLGKIILISGGDVGYLLTDDLTGVYRKDVFLRLLPRHLSLLERHRRQATVVFFDLNNLKRLNDSLGYEAGDSLIADFSSGLRESLRQSDLACRWGGGDEFVVVIDGDKAESLVFIDRMVAAIAAVREGVSFSYGVSLIDERGGFDAAVKRAESEMKEMKRKLRGGRE